MNIRKVLGLIAIIIGAALVIISMYVKKPMQANQGSMAAPMSSGQCMAPNMPAQSMDSKNTMMSASNMPFYVLLAGGIILVVVGVGAMATKGHHPHKKAHKKK
jgi:hypothetical protein